MNCLSISKRTQVLAALVERNSINRTATISGTSDPQPISTSFIERQNLTMRMGMGRVIQLTMAFPNNVENRGHAMALHLMHYKFCLVHKTFRVTPAMEAGLTYSYLGNR
jgi:hypothetical protein